MDNYQKIVSFLSSSELNRCKKNGLEVYRPNNWIEVLKQPWLTRKLRRKIGHMFNLDILPKYKNVIPIYGVGDMDYSVFKDLFDHLPKSYLDAEDKFILTGKL